MFKITGKNDSDHNTISINTLIPYIQKPVILKQTGWNIRADDDKWNKFTNELRKRKQRAIDIITDTERPIDERYKKFCNEIENAARMSIGKTTFKNKFKVRVSETVKNLQKEKNNLKSKIQAEANETLRNDLKTQYKNIQKAILEEMTREKAEVISEKLEKIANSGNKNDLWALKRRITRDHSLEYLALFSYNGNKHFR